MSVPTISVPGCTVQGVQFLLLFQQSGANSLQRFTHHRTQRAWKKPRADILLQETFTAKDDKCTHCIEPWKLTLRVLFVLRPRARRSRVRHVAASADTHTAEVWPGGGAGLRICLGQRMLNIFDCV